MQHDVSRKAMAATSRGLSLRKLTEAHLAKLVDNREYLVMRYEPAWDTMVSQVNRLMATLDELERKIAPVISRKID